MILGPVRNSFRKLSLLRRTRHSSILVLWPPLGAESGALHRDFFSSLIGWIQCSRGPRIESMQMLERDRYGVERRPCDVGAILGGNSPELDVELPGVPTDPGWKHRWWAWRTHPYKDERWGPYLSDGTRPRRCQGHHQTVTCGPLTSLPRLDGRLGVDTLPMAPRQGECSVVSRLHDPSVPTKTGVSIAWGQNRIGSASHHRYVVTVILPMPLF